MAADGTWNVNLNTPMGAQAVTLELATEGASLSGSMKSAMGGADFDGGTVDGNSLAWVVAMTQPMPITIEFAAAVDGDTISGKAKLGELGDASFEGTRGLTLDPMDPQVARNGLSFMGVHLTVRDMAAARAFYQQCGLDVPEPVGGGVHVDIPVGDGVHLALSTEQLTRQYDAGWRTPALPPGSALQFQVASRAEVDALYERLTSAGYHGHLAPIDAFWGSRYAEVDDPDGNIVGFHSVRSL